jgi:hypothetical protein
MFLPGVGGPRRWEVLSREAVVVGTRQWWGRGFTRWDLRSKRRRQRRMLKVVVAIVGEVPVIGYNQRPGWQNRFKSVVGAGAHGRLRPGGKIAVARGKI